MKVSAIVLVISLVFIGACGKSYMDNTIEYPIKLGFSREQVQSLLGSPDLNNPSTSIEWYPKSGVTVIYNKFNSVSELVFFGCYRHVYWQMTKRTIVKGINPRMNIKDVLKILGKEDVVKESVFVDKGNYGWKFPDFNLEVEFFKKEFKDSGGYCSEGAISQINVSKGIN